MLAGTAALVIEHHHRRAAVQIVAAVTPQVSAFGLARPRVQLFDRGLVGVQHLPLFEQFRQPVGQGLQGETDATYPFAHRAARQEDLLPGGDLFQSVQRQVIQIFAGRDPSQQAGRGQRAVNHRRGDRCRRDGFALAAGILRADMADHEEARWFDIQLLADIFADLDQVGLAGGTGTGFRFVAHLDPLQMFGQGLATCAGSRGGWHRGQFELCLDGGDILQDVILEQLTLFRVHRFALDPVADAPEISDLLDQCLNLDFLRADDSGKPGNFVVTRGQLRGDKALPDKAGETEE